MLALVTYLICVDVSTQTRNEYEQIVGFDITMPVLTHGRIKTQHADPSRNGGWVTTLS